VRSLKAAIIFGLLVGGILSQPAQAQQLFQNSVYRVREIHISGNNVFSEAQLRKKMNLHTGKFSTFGRPAEFNKRVLQLDKINLTSFYRTQGYINCSIQDSFEVTQNRKVVLFLHITEGQQYYLRSIQFNGNHLLTDQELMTYFTGVKVNRPFNPYQFREALDQIETRYENEGKPFENIQSQLNIQGTDIQAVVNIKENQTVSIHTIKIEGLDNVKDLVVRREITLKPGDRYSQEELRESQRRLFETGLFADVTINPVPSNPDSQTVDLLVNVRNMDFRSLRFDLGARQYESTPGTEPYTALEASVEWIHRNLVSQARRLSFSASGRVNVNDLSFLPSGQIRYTEPWLGRLRIPTTLRLYYDYNIFTRNQQPIYQWGTDLTFLHSQRRRLILRSILRFQETILTGDTLQPLSSGAPMDTVSTQVAEELRRGQERSIGFLFRKDERDNFLSPTQGYLLEFEPEFFLDVLGGTSNFYRIQFTMGKYWPVLNGATLAGRVKVGSLHYYDGEHGYIPDYELFYLGGATSVRGFAADQLKWSLVKTKDGTVKRVPAGGRVKLLANLEFRFPIYWKFGAEVFLDAGQLWPDYSALNLLSMRYSTGFGITFATPLGPARVDFGRKLGPLQPGEKPWITHLALQYAF